jgi:hypothetical protein
MLPVVNKEYYFYDDWKIKDTREYIIKITDIIKYKTADYFLQKLLKSEIEKDRDYFQGKTDYFLKGLLYSEYEENSVEMIFVRHITGEFVSIGNNTYNGVLDVSEKYRKIVENDEIYQGYD